MNSAFRHLRLVVATNETPQKTFEKQRKRTRRCNDGLKGFKLQQAVIRNGTKFGVYEAREAINGEFGAISRS